MNPAADVRARARSGRLAGPTCRLAPGYLQANLVIVPDALASDFHLFCARNPKHRRLARPDFGDAVTVRPGEVPLFWACGVTPQAVVMEAGPELAIRHSPGCMFVTDRLADGASDGRG